MARPGVLAAVAALPLAAVVWLGTGGPAAPRSADEEVQEAVRRSVEDLGSPDRAERVAAERRLFELGPNALPWLPSAKEANDVATAEAVARLRKQLEIVQATQSVRATRSQLTGTGKAKDVLGGYVLTSEQGERQVSFSGESMPFWVATDEAARQLGAWPGEADDFARLGFRERTTNDESKRVAYPGVFRVAAGPAGLRPIAGAADRRLLRVPVEIRAEPTVRVLFLSYAASDFSVEVEGGRTFAPFVPESKLELPVGEFGGKADLRVDFGVPGKLPDGPVTLRGKAVATVAAGQEAFRSPFEAAGWDRTTRETRGEVTVEFREAVLQPNGTAEVEIAVVYDEGGPAFESHRTWVYHNLARVLFESEQDDRPALGWIDHEPNFSLVAERNGGAVVRYRFEGVPSDAREVSFAYTAPTGIVDVPVEFAIPGLPVEGEPRKSKDGATEADDSRDPAL